VNVVTGASKGKVAKLCVAFKEVGVNRATRGQVGE